MKLLTLFFFAGTLAAQISCFPNCGGGGGGGGTVTGVTATAPLKTNGASTAPNVSGNYTTSSPGSSGLIVVNDGTQPLPTAGDCAEWVAYISGGVTLGDLGVPCGTGSVAFGAVTTGTNTNAAMTVGTGGSILHSGTGVVDANKINGTALSSLATGILKNTTSTGVPSAALSSDVVALFSTCSGTQYLGADGACHSAGAGAGYTRGLTSSKPACSSTYTGRLYFATDSPLSYGCNGTTDQAYDGTTAVSPPGSLGSYTSLAPTGTTVTQVGDTVSIFNNNTAFGYSGFYTTSTFTPGSSSVVTAGNFNGITTGAGVGQPACGPGIYGDATHILTFGFFHNGTIPEFVIYGSGVTTTSTALAAVPDGPIFLRLRSVSSTSLVSEVSLDGGSTYFQVFPGVNISSYTNHYMGVFCGDNAASGSIAAMSVRHFAFQ